MNIKKVFPIELNYKLKNILKPNPKNEINIEIGDKNIYFLDAPGYGNIGDQAIAYAMEKYMSDKFPEYNQIEILENDIHNHIRQLKCKIKSNDIICLTGGGNMGIMYQRYEAIRRMIIKKFPNNKIIIFPQTIDYENTKYGIQEQKRASKIYNKHKNIFIMAREKKSYKKMKEIFNECNVALCPDIVLYLDYFDINNNRKKSIGICMRNDEEKIKNIFDINKAKNISDKINYITTTENSNQLITRKNRQKVVENKLSEIAKNEYFITDRLHGMIFAYITNTNCIALPNSNGKVEGVFNWIKDKGKVHFEKKFTGKFSNYNKKNISLEQEFDVLYKKISIFLNS